MYNNILVPIALDHSPNNAKALEVAQKLVSDGGNVTVLHVLEDIPPYVAQYLPEGQLSKNANEAGASLKTEAGNVPGAEIKVVTGHSGTTITEYAVEHGSDLIIIASHRPGLQDFFLGSTAARVVRHAPCCVHVVR